MPPRFSITQCNSAIRWVAALSLLITPAVGAQTPSNIEVAPKPNPNLDRFPQPQPSPQPLPPSDQQPQLSPPQPSEPPSSPSEITISVKRVEVIGNTVLTPAEMTKIISAVEGRSVTLEQLRGVADSLTQLYLNQGYITSRAVLVDQQIVDGVVKIRVIEGSLEKITVQGTQRLTNYVHSRIQLGAQPPLSKDALEDQLRLLKADPLFTHVEASLKPGTGMGQSILNVRVTEAPPFSPFLNVDNYSPPSVGSEQFGGGISYRNLTGLGDELSGSYYQSTTSGSKAFDFNYRVPINPMNGTVQLRIAPSRSLITDPAFKAFGIRSQTNLYEISYRQPLVRTPREELALSAGFALQDGQTFLFDNVPTPFGIGPDAEGRSRTRVLKLGQDYVKRDPLGAWALRSQFSLGLGIFNATENDGPAPDGQFFAWLGQIQRVQRLGKDHLLIAQADLQLTPDSLLPSQQFVIGGGQSLRGYRQNVRSGDNGFRVSLEDRIALQRDEGGIPTLQLAPFIDAGAVWNQSDNPNRLSNETFLVAGGLGLIWQPVPKLLVRLEYAVPFVGLTDRGNNAQDRGFYFSVNYTP